MKYILATLNVKEKYDETNELSSVQDQPSYKHNSKTKNKGCDMVIDKMVIALSPNSQETKAFHAQN